MDHTVLIVAPTAYHLTRSTLDYEIANVPVEYNAAWYVGTIVPRYEP